MASKLVPCGACARHVKDSEQTCPFCGADVAAAIEAARASAMPRPLGRLSRAALAAVSAAGALAATDCSSTSAVPLYGANFRPTDSGDSMTDGAASDDGGSGDDSGQFVQPVYGAMIAPPDAAADAAEAAPDASADAGDAGVRLDGATIQPLYGGFFPKDGGP